MQNRENADAQDAGSLACVKEEVSSDAHLDVLNVSCLAGSIGAV